MRRIVCEDCKKLYDYDKDEFCPRCGAFNQPVKTWDTDSQGNVIRVDGVNERGHAGSFVHSEVHKEKNIRKITGMDYQKRPQPRQTVQQPRKSLIKSKVTDSTFFPILLWVAGAVIFATVILPFFFSLF